LAQLVVTINARQFRVACEDGQEDHLTRLAGDVDQRVQTMRSQFGEVGDMRLTIMAAITLADELSEAETKIHALEQELMSMRDARHIAAERMRATESAFVDVIASTAERIEKIAKSLSQSPAAARA
jgi:cell division protein ZapA